jgi:hypothetical protein
VAKIFVSYSRANRDLVEPFVENLAATFIDEGIFYDKLLTGGKGWWQDILQHIGEASVFVYLITNESLASYACRAEYLEAMRLGKHIVPIDLTNDVHLDNTDPPLAFILGQLQRLPADQTGLIIRTIADGLRESNVTDYHDAIREIRTRDVHGETVNIGGTIHYNITYVVEDGNQPIRQPESGGASIITERETLEREQRSWAAQRAREQAEIDRQRREIEQQRRQPPQPQPTNHPVGTGHAPSVPPPQPKPDTVPRLNWWNPTHGLLLLWWMSFAPAQIAAHKEQHGETAHETTGSLLAQTVAWLPLFIMTLALALRPELAAAWNYFFDWTLPAYAFPLIVLVPALLMVTAPRRFTDELNWTFFVGFGVVFGVTLVVVVGLAYVVAGDVADFVAGVVSVVIAGGMAGGVAFVVTGGLAGVIAGGVSGGVAFVVAFVVAFGGGVGGGVVSRLLAVVTVFVMVLFIVLVLAGGVLNIVEASIKAKRPNLLTRAILPALVLSNAVVAWVAFTAPVVTP